MSHSVLLQFEADFYLHHCLRWFPSNKDGSILNLTPMLTYYDTKKNPKPKLRFQRRKLQEDKDKQKQGLFSVQCPQFLFFKGGRSYVALFPFNHSSRSQ